MIKFFAALILSLPLLGYAKETNNVWLFTVGGNLETLCRKMWDAYDSKHDTTTVFHVKQGASGELATKDILESTIPDRSMCAGSAQILYNQYVPDLKSRGHEIDLIVKVANFPQVWYVPNSTPTVRNLNEYVEYLRSLNRPINVGVWLGIHNTLAKHLAKTYNLTFNLVTFKNGTQTHPSLYDGTLDLAFDTGGSVNVAETGKFKIVGYTSNSKFTKLANYVNFVNHDKELSNIEGWWGVGVPMNTPAAVKEQLAKRLRAIVQEESYAKYSDGQFGGATGLIGNELKQDLAKQAALVKKYSQ